MPCADGNPRSRKSVSPHFPKQQKISMSLRAFSWSFAIVVVTYEAKRNWSASLTSALCSYAEIQVVEEIFDKDSARKMGIDKVVLIFRYLKLFTSSICLFQSAIRGVSQISWSTKTSQCSALLFHASPICEHALQCTHSAPVTLPRYS